MPNIHFIPDDQNVEAGIHQTILSASLNAKIPHAHACGGKARCSTCRVLILEGLEHCAPRTEKEKILAAQLNFDTSLRLACQTQVTGDVKLRRLVLDEEDLDLVTQLDGINGAGAAGEERLLAILFADIRGYTSFSEKLPPYDVIYSLNRYYHRVGKIITRNKGYIDNYMGDGLMALFGLEGDEDSVFNAIRSGLEMLEAVEHLSPYFELLYGCSFKIGVGVHYGQVVVGSIGFQKKRTSVIGDSVNFASRIEEANKQAGTNFLISEAAYRQTKDQIKTKTCSPMAIPGKEGLYHLYEVLGISNPESG